MRKSFKLLLGCLLLPLLAVDIGMSAIKSSSTPKLPIVSAFTVGGWVPYWREASGTQEIINNISKINIISPFSYEMSADGRLIDKMKLGTGPYSEMLKIAEIKKKLVIPTILWYPADDEGRDKLDSVLRDAKSRTLLVNDIIKEIDKYKVHGVDIDFENKKAETRDSFSLFIEELSVALHKKSKLLICTIEARTPSDTEFVIGPSKDKDSIRANDYKRLGKACDQVRIMTYDQGDVGNSTKSPSPLPYKPVADIDWVKKVLTLAMRDIPWKKIIVGVPTYGYKYEIIRDEKQNIISYIKVGSMNYYYANEEAKQKKLIPTRHKSGELYYTYIDESNQKEYLVWYSDAVSIRQKQDLAKIYKLGGIIIFKIDGQNDKNIWTNI